MPRMIWLRGTALTWIALLVGALVLSACRAQSPSPEKTSAVATFYPLYEFTRRVGGDRVEVRLLISAGAEPHDYEPTPQDVALLRRARVVVYNGAGFEPWIEKLLDDLPQGTVVVNATEGVPLHAGSGNPDPHVWLDPVLAQEQVDRILRGLLRADPAGEAAYRENAEALKRALMDLDARFRQTLARCRTRTFLASHAAFGYLARRYGLTMLSISGLAPEAEPSPARLRDLVREARRRGVEVVYGETLTSDRVARALAQELGARLLVLNPLEGLTPQEQQAGKDYFGVMDENRHALAQGLGCR